jgi:hypothetical protein
MLKKILMGKKRKERVFDLTKPMEWVASNDSVLNLIKEERGKLVTELNTAQLLIFPFLL